MKPRFIVDGPKSSLRTLVLAHGAGAPMDSSFMERVASGIAADGFRVVRFEFPYMAARRDGTRRSPDKASVLVDTWKKVIDANGDPKRLAIGGKSMGGRIATMVADECGVGGLVALGYPFHPPGKPQQTRTSHLRDLRTPTLIVQGTRDPLGSRDDVAQYDLSKKIEIVWIEDGDHSFKPRARSGRTEKENVQEAVTLVVDWLTQLR